jgi:hypothetical protein
MSLIRFTIGEMKALVLLIALNIGAWKALGMGNPSPPAHLFDLLGFVALPMANVLAIGLILLARRRAVHGKSRAALVGFELGGLAGLLVFVACSLIFTHPLHEGVGRVVHALGVEPSLFFAVCAASVLLAPQLALALLGARLSRTFKTSSDSV